MVLHIHIYEDNILYCSAIRKLYSDYYSAARQKSTNLLGEFKQFLYILDNFLPAALVKYATSMAIIRLKLQSAKSSREFLRTGACKLSYHEINHSVLPLHIHTPLYLRSTQRILIRPLGPKCIKRIAKWRAYPY